MTTFLSEHVSQLYSIADSNEDYSHCFEGCLFNWVNVGQALGIADYIHCSFAERYMSAASALWGIIYCGGKLFLQKPISQEYRLHLNLSRWCCKIDIEKYYEKFINSPEDNNILLETMLKLTGVLDRSLGNIILLKEKEVPFLMRDLLQTVALENILGREPVFFMQLLMGNVKGLNIRNIVWHGFFSKNEIKAHLVATFFLLIPSIGKTLLSKGYILENIPRRPSTILHPQAELLKSYSLVLSDYSDIYKTLVRNIPYISIGQEDFWFYAFELYRKGCFGDAIVIILPLMEHMLRSAYCEVNNCDSKKMTAETTEFYITLDVILAKTCETKENNLLIVLGNPIVEMLLDLFNYQNGLRLRDRVSHYELDVDDVPEDIANFTITLCISIMQQLLPQTLDAQNESDKTQKLINIQEQYEPLFHPTSLLKRRTCFVLNKIKDWSSLPRPPEFNNYTLWNNNENFKCLESLLENLITKKNYSAEEFLQEIIVETKKLKYPSLFRPPKEIETVNLFQRIISSIEEIDSNVKINLNSRYNLWSTRQMRSRQRDNYGRMMEYICVVHLFLCCIIYLQNSVVQKFFALSELQLLHFIKYFKCCLKYVENVCSLSQINKNRWEEIKDITDKCCSLCVDMVKNLENKY